MQFRVQGLGLRECVQYNGGATTHRALASACGPFSIRVYLTPQTPSSGVFWVFASFRPHLKSNPSVVPDCAGHSTDFRQITRLSCPAKVSRSVNVYPERNILTQNPRRGPKHANNKKTWGRNVKRSRAFIVPVNREALAWLTVLSRRSAGGGGLGRSLECPCKWSAALSAV